MIILSNGGKFVSELFARLSKLDKERDELIGTIEGLIGNKATAAKIHAKLNGTKYQPIYAKPAKRKRAARTSPAEVDAMVAGLLSAGSDLTFNALSRQMGSNRASTWLARQQASGKIERTGRGVYRFKPQPVDVVQ